MRFSNFFRDSKLWDTPLSLPSLFLLFILWLSLQTSRLVYCSRPLAQNLSIAKFRIFYPNITSNTYYKGLKFTTSSSNHFSQTEQYINLKFAGLSRFSLTSALTDDISEQKLFELLYIYPGVFTCLTLFQACSTARASLYIIYHKLVMDVLILNGQLSILM